VVVVAVVVLALFCTKRKKRTQSRRRIDLAQSEQVQVPWEAATTPSIAYTPSPPLMERVRDSTLHNTPLSSSRAKLPSPPDSPFAAIPRAPITVAVDAGAPRPPSGPETAIPASELTREQARFLYELHNLNVPAPAIANLVAEMLTGRDEGESGTREGNARPLPGRPPGYDFKER
jgi:hypothetical protein